MTQHDPPGAATFGGSSSGKQGQPACCRAGNQPNGQAGGQGSRWVPETREVLAASQVLHDALHPIVATMAALGTQPHCGHTRGRAGDHTHEREFDGWTRLLRGKLCGRQTSRQVGGQGRRVRPV